MKLLPSLLDGRKAVCAAFPDSREGRGARQSRRGYANAPPPRRLASDERGLASPRTYGRNASAARMVTVQPLKPKKLLTVPVIVTKSVVEVIGAGLIVKSNPPVKLKGPASDDSPKPSSDG